jgi:hypothetical protein
VGPVPSIRSWYWSPVGVVINSAGVGLMGGSLY